MRFNPQHYEDITSFFEDKISVLYCYDEEMRPEPHARSYEAIRALAKFRGSEVGLHYAEAFEIIRSIS